jgi:membrane protein DedA with SNARE-associated domain
LQGLLEHFGYAAVFGLLVVAGVGVPVPEELTQLTAGVLSHEGYLRFGITLPVVWAGIVAGDAILFLLARRHGPRALESRAARRVLTPPRREKLERHFARHAFLTIALARHAGGLRFAAFALAGATGVRPATFLLADGLSALASVPIVVRLLELAALAAALAGAWIAVRVRRRRGAIERRA